MTRVAITGLGCVCASGGTLTEIMPELYAGRRSPALPTILSAEVDRMSPVFEVNSRFSLEASGTENATNASRTTLLALKAFAEASRQSRLFEEPIDPLRVGVIIGTTVGCTLNNEEFYKDYLENRTPGIAPIEKYLANNPAKYLSRHFGYEGPSVTIANACSSGTDAIGLGKQWIESGNCDIVIAGGTDELCRTTYLGFTSLLITSSEACRPLDKDRSGLNLGEGAGIVIIESEDFAHRRGVKPLAYLRGYGSSADAYHTTAPHPDGLGLRRAIDIALKDAELPRQNISFINIHGTATNDNDKVEGRVVSEEFARYIPVVSTKGYTGHTLGAAGAIEAVFTVMGLLDGMIPETPGFTTADEACLITPTTEKTSISGNVAMSTSLAFGGTNSALIMGLS